MNYTNVKKLISVLTAGLFFLAAAPASDFSRAVFTASCSAQTAGAGLESDVKAAYIINIIKFIDWHTAGKNGDKTVKIGLAGSDPICEVLEKISKNKIAGFSITTHRIDGAAAGSSECQLIFIGRSENKRLSEILKQLKGSPALTVSDIPDFAERGGIMGFFIEKNRVKIEINLNEAKRAGLKLGAKLLEVARLIK